MKRTIVFGAAALCMGVWTAGGMAQSNTEANKPTLTHVKDVENMEIAPWGDGIPAYFEDVVATKRDAAPMTCALFRMEKGKPLVYDYDYDDIKIILEGEMKLEDGSQTITAKKGDVVYIPKGAHVTFTADDYGVGWACGQR